LAPPANLTYGSCQLAPSTTDELVLRPGALPIPSLIVQVAL